jgi:OOP family OmpA-OmpF porin
MARAFALALVAALGASGCASDPTANLVAVLPEADGHIGGVVVQDLDGGRTLLDQPYEAVGAASGSTAAEAVSVGRAEVGTVFRAALAAQPIPPASFLLYFENDSDVLTPPSQLAFEDVFSDIARRRAADIAVTGHTDTMGELAYNDGLALERARRVGSMLIARGLPPGDVTAAGRGERELLVRTGDEDSEPRNRRVVITVR